MDLRDLSTSDPRRAITVVPQDIYLFHGTIADNIRLGRPEATDADVEQVALRAGAHEFRTTVVIAHRPSTIRRADRVVVLDAGRITATGIYDELLATSEDFRRILATP